MEINKFEDVVGVIPTANVVEGRFVLLTAHHWTSDFGSKEDVPGCKVPSTAAEASAARFCITWAADNQSLPFYETLPTLDNSFALRGGWSRGANLPLSATIYMTHHANGAESQTIPSGMASIAYTHGTFTLPSGSFVYDANIITVGANLVVAFSGADAGKLAYQANYDARVVGNTVEYDADANKLTARII
jgi:hypothetical protein